MHTAHSEFIGEAPYKSTQYVTPTEGAMVTGKLTGQTAGLAPARILASDFFKLHQGDGRGMGNLGEASLVGWKLMRYLNLSISGGCVQGS